ncbi:MAG TPA: ABC transporter C-terminal domain-containing protein, partial [Candidatus Ozemobacteraceae bacterium]
PAPAAAPVPSRSDRPARQKLTFKERRELDEIVARIAASEARKAEIESLLAAPAGGFEAMKALSDELERLTQALDTDLERWTELAERE